MKAARQRRKPKRKRTYCVWNLRLRFGVPGRGERFFGRPNHDSDLFRERVGAVPLGGFFCNGEIGPVGARTFLHGYTSSFALFRPAAS